MEEFFRAAKSRPSHYWHTSLPADFIEKAGRIFDRLRGIDTWVDRTSKEDWIDMFRTEMDYRSALEIYIECLSASAKLERRYSKVSGAPRQAFYYLALARSGCSDPEEAFRMAREHYGVQFDGSGKRHLLRVIDNCVRYRPYTYVTDAPEQSLRIMSAANTGAGKSCSHILLGLFRN